MSNKKIIVFDFDKTLTYNDTLFGFYRHASKKNIFYPFKLLVYVSAMILSKVKVICNPKLKNIGIILFIKDITKTELKLKFSNYKQKINFNFLFKETDFNLLDGDVYVISASFEEYIKVIFPENIKVIGSQIAYENNFPARLTSNMYGEQKVVELLRRDITYIDELYTDSISDVPLVEISKKTYLISGDNTTECYSVEEFKKAVMK